MGLLGPANWWAPRWLQRVHARIDTLEAPPPRPVPVDAPAHVAAPAVAARG